jgi:hypothetical protein
MTTFSRATFLLAADTGSILQQCDQGASVLITMTQALRFPTNAHKKELETAQELRERANELKNIGEDELGDDDDDEGDF